MSVSSVPAYSFICGIKLQSNLEGCWEL